MSIALVLSLHNSEKWLSLLFLAHLTFELYNLPVLLHLNQTENKLAAVIRQECQ